MAVLMWLRNYVSMLKLISKKIIITVLLLNFVSCEKIKNQLADFAADGESGQSLSVVVPPEKSLSKASNLPIIKGLRTISAEQFDTFIQAGDRISIVEFYSDT